MRDSAIYFMIVFYLILFILSVCFPGHMLFYTIKDKIFFFSLLKMAAPREMLPHEEVERKRLEADKIRCEFAEAKSEPKTEASKMELISY